MAVTSVDRTNSVGNGVKEYLRTFDNNINSAIIQVGADINAEILPYLNGFPGEIQELTINWFLHLNVIPDAYHSKYASALPKFNFGSIATTWCGSQTSEHFVNFEQQIIGDFITSTTTLGKLYPDEPDIPALLLNADVSGTFPQVNTQTCHRADTLYISSLEQFSGDVFIRCWYSAWNRLLRPPASITFFNEGVNLP